MFLVLFNLQSAFSLTEPFLSPRPLIKLLADKASYPLLSGRSPWRLIILPHLLPHCQHLFFAFFAFLSPFFTLFFRPSPSCIPRAGNIPHLPPDPRSPSCVMQLCRIVKHIGQRTRREIASRGASWESCWSGGYVQ